MVLEEKIKELKILLAEIGRDFTPAALASSFGAEDMVLIDLIARLYPAIEIFTLDTGRLPEETHKLMREVIDRYGVRLRVYYPESRSVERYVSEHGLNAFYRSIELRKACCEVRKVEPLRRALAGKRAWVTGLRREQAATRKELAVSEFDSEHGLMKFNPLVEWSNQDIWSYIQGHRVPFNALHEKGYPSIGCAPCTRAVRPGEDIRAGRWWWESPETKECGLHLRKAAAR